MVSPVQNVQPLVQGYNTNIIRIQGGRETAMNYPVQLNYTALLLDEENKMFFIKTRDQNGTMQPMREFNYEEIVAKNQDESSQYVTKEDFNKLLEEVKKLQKHSRSNSRKNYKPYNNNK